MVVLKIALQRRKNKQILREKQFAVGPTPSWAPKLVTCSRHAKKQNASEQTILSIHCDTGKIRLAASTRKNLGTPSETACNFGNLYNYLLGGSLPQELGVSDGLWGGGNASRGFFGQVLVSPYQREIRREPEAIASGNIEQVLASVGMQGTSRMKELSDAPDQTFVHQQRPN
jgi:hypothetical protein